ncbi:hypothetical protein PRUPE_5G169600 [Prunus persica]|uniref:Kinetochore protein SPC25 n=1 Tax=Prunus persica TaxID=3760 RepID=A0A251P9N1_PRUPE|nr:hypothetical protein PRUPE_5G169600 [Prunus persica]
MDSQPEESVRTKMESLRMACEKEIPILQQNMDTFTASFQGDLASIRATVQETLRYQGKVGEAKAKLREAEDELFKALAVKTRKEAKRMALMDAIAARKARIEEIKRTVQDRRDTRDEYAAILSQQSTGVKFTFKNICSKNPNQEFSFTVRHANDTYTLLDCDPHLNEIKELIRELNRTNGLFKFVRDMRLKFQEAAAQGLTTVLPQDSSSISGSAPAFSVSTERSESVAKIGELQIQYGEDNSQFKKPNHGKGSKYALLSPRSASSVRRSPRFKVKK